MRTIFQKIVSSPQECVFDTFCTSRKYISLCGGSPQKRVLKTSVPFFFSLSFVSFPREQHSPPLSPRCRFRQARAEHNRVRKFHSRSKRRLSASAYILSIRLPQGSTKLQVRGRRRDSSISPQSLLSPSSSVGNDVMSISPSLNFFRSA